MKRLKIMQEDPVSSKDPFGMNDLQDRLKLFCKEQSLDNPQFWIIKPDEYYMGYAVSLHLSGKDRWEEFDANVVLLLDRSHKKYRQKKEARLIGEITAEFNEPVLLTLPVTMSMSRRNLLKNLGLTLMPVRWSGKGQDEYGVYLKGQMEMGPFANLMERVEYIGKEIVYR